MLLSAEEAFIEIVDTSLLACGWSLALQDDLSPHHNPGASHVITVSICPSLQQVWLWFTNPCDTRSSQCEEQKSSGSSLVVLGRWLTSDLTHLIAVNVLAWPVIRSKHHLLFGGSCSEAKIPLGTCSMLDTRCCLLSVVQSSVLLNG